jgi:hypothetical protein
MSYTEAHLPVGDENDFDPKAAYRWRDLVGVARAGATLFEAHNQETLANAAEHHLDAMLRRRFPPTAFSQLTLWPLYGWSGNYFARGEAHE